MMKQIKSSLTRFGNRVKVATFRLGAPVLVALALIVAWGATPFWVPYVARRLVPPEKALPDATESPTERDEARDLALSAQLGDMFGAINSLFSGLALIGVAYGLYLQIEHKRREKQPEIFARLASNTNEDQVVLAPMMSTPQGAVHLTLEVPVYITTASTTPAFNVAVFAEMAGGEAEETLPVPVLSASSVGEPTRLRIEIPASALASEVSGWQREKESAYPLGRLKVRVAFENHQRAKWQVVAEYSVTTRTLADANLLYAWIHNATATGDGPKSIQLVAIAKSWVPTEL